VRSDRGSGGGPSHNWGRTLLLAGGIGAGALLGALWPGSDLPTIAPTPANLSEAPAFADLNNGPADTTPLPFDDAPADPPAPAGEAPHYRYCSEARAAGVAPLYQGDPGYAPHLDADGDGVACEPYRGR